MGWHYDHPEMKAETVVVPMTFVKSTHVMPPQSPSLYICVLRPGTTAQRRRQKLLLSPWHSSKAPMQCPAKSIPLHLCSTTRNDRPETKAEVVVPKMKAEQFTARWIRCAQAKPPPPPQKNSSKTRHMFVFFGFSGGCMGCDSIWGRFVPG